MLYNYSEIYKETDIRIINKPHINIHITDRHCNWLNEVVNG